MTKHICDAVFEGGGVRGIGFVGAIKKFEEAGYRFRHVAGSSAGAIVASLIVAGYTADEMYEELAKISFEDFKTSGSVWQKAIGPIGLLINANKNFGLHSTKQFEDWIEKLLSKKGVHTFADIGDRLKVTASDITDERILVLPDDLAKFGIDPKTFSVATAVRMSMSIPVYYEPYELLDPNGNVHYIVDGGLMSNYPIWLLDTGARRMDIPVFGFRFRHYPGANKGKKNNLIAYIKQVINTIVEGPGGMTDALVHGDTARTVVIDSKVDDHVVAITDFGISPETINALHENGKIATTEFLETWDFKKWKKNYRKKN